MAKEITEMGANFSTDEKSLNIDKVSEAREFVSLLHKLSEQEKFGFLLMIQGAKLLAEK